MEDITALQDGKLGPGLKKFITEQVVNKGKEKETLVISESTLGMYPQCDIFHKLILDFSSQLDC